MRSIAIFGTSGYASEVADICHDIGFTNIVFLAVEQKDRNGTSIFLENEVPAMLERGFEFAIGIGNPNIRRIVSKRYSHLPFPCLIHPAAGFGRFSHDILKDKNGVIIAAGARLMSNVVIGNHCILGINSVIGHDSIISDYCSIMPGAIISGNVYLESMVTIGAGAIINQGNSIQKLCVGENSTIGSGAVVTRNVSKNCIAVGIPARPVS